MTPSRPRRLAAALAASLTLAVLLVAVPAGLVAAAGWPLPTELPSIASLENAARSGPSPAAVADVLAVIAWLAWLQLAVAILTETAAAIGRRPARHLPLLPGMQSAAAKLVATAAFLGAVGQQPAAVAAGSLQAALAAPAPITAPQPTAEPVSEPAARQLQREVEPAPLTEYTTGPRDTWWQLAELHLGDGLKWRDLRQINLGRHVTSDLVLTTEHDSIDEGWTLLVPATQDTPSLADPSPPDQHPAPEAASEPEDSLDTHQEEEGPAEVDEWTVTDGDHFWSIAETTLTDTLGRAPTDEETTSYWRELIDANQDRLLPPHDPDLIYPDQQLTRPGISPELSATPAPEQGDEQATPPAEPASPEPPTVVPDRLDPSSSGDATHAEEPNDDDTASPTGKGEPEVEGERSRIPRDWTGAIDQRTGPFDADDQQPEAATDEASGQDTEPDRNAWGLPVDLRAGVAASALAAAGIAALLRRRRRQSLQQRPAGLRLPTPAPDVSQTIRDLDAAAPDAQALEDLTTLLCSIPPEARPALVTTTDEGEVTLLFDDDTERPPPPEPWQPTDTEDAGPVGWHAKLGDHGPIRSIGLPLLVTLGRRHDRNVLANSGALKTLHVDGDADHVRRRLRAIALEVATSRTAGPVEVLVHGDDPPVDVDHVRRIDNPDAEIASAQAEHDQDIVAEDRTIRLLVAHDSGTALTVPEELAATFGVLAAGRCDDGWLLELTDHATGRLRLPDGGWIDLDLPDFAPDHLGDALHPEAAGHEDRDDGAETGELLIQLIEPAFCEIHILGNPTVIRDGQPVEGINGKALEAITYIATHRDGVTAEQLEDAVWNGRATATGSQRVRAALARARDLLGDGPDGQPLVPRRIKGQHLVRLSEHVATDLDRALGHLKLARTLPDQLRTGELRAALDLVRGQPFQGWPLSWATDIHQRAVAQLQDAALELAGLYRTAGDHEAAIAAVERGLKLCDPAEPLYVEWARIESDLGRTEQIDEIWERLCRKYHDGEASGGAWTSCPTSSAEQAFADLSGIRKGS